MTTFLKSSLMSLAIFAIAGQIPAYAEDERYSPVTNEKTKVECSDLPYGLIRRVSCPRTHGKR